MDSSSGLLFHFSGAVKTIEIDLSVEDTLTMGGSILAGKMNTYKKQSNSAEAHWFDQFHQINPITFLQ